ncbi:MAG: glycosyltransferase family 39 protein [Sedimentisphaerales bacterium]|nr:glycosyltransferase family 39 protein [Sedimentisphaerales bacterium]
MGLMNKAGRISNLSIMLTSSPTKTALLIAIIILALYLLISTRTTLWDRDEPRYARAAVEMVESGNYLVPAFNGQMWLDKPPLLYWLMSVPVRLFGSTEFACRFFGAVGSAITALLTFFIGRRLFGTKAGLWAMVVLASTLMMLVVGSSALTDAVLLPIIVAVMAVFTLSIENRPSSFVRRLSTLVMGIVIGLGMLAKGPIGLMPIPVLLVTLWLGKKFKLDFKISYWQIGAALLLGFLIFSAWALPANKVSNGEFFRFFIGRHVISRAINPMEHHGGNFLLYLPYYLVVIIVGFFPWTLHLPGALSAVAGGRVGGSSGRVFLFGWIAAPLIIMTLVATKLPHYILFIWPALALAVGGTIVASQQNMLNDRDKIWLRRGGWFFAPLVIAIAIGLIIGPWFVEVPGLCWSGLVSGIVLLVMMVIAIHWQQANRPEVSAKVMLIGMFIFMIPVLFGVLPAVERVKLSPPIAEAVKAETLQNVPVATYKYGEPTLNFYIGRQIEELRSEEDVVSWAKEPIDGILVIPKDKMDGIRQRYGDLPLNEIASKKGFNYSKGTALELAALIRKMEKQ